MIHNGAVPMTRVASFYLRAGGVLLASVCLACSTPPPPATRAASPATVTQADTDLHDYQLRAVETHVQALAAGPERDYFSGMLAARTGRFAEAIAQLGRALPSLRQSNPKRAAIALDALATAYRAMNQYGDAARAYDELSDRFADQVDGFPADDAAMARILRDSPPQTIAWHGPVRLRTAKNPIGSRSTALVVNGVRARWMLDTGANQSVVSRSFADRLGLTPLAGTAAVGSGLTGRQSPLRVALLPTLHIGGAELSNVVLTILDDENLRFGSGPDAYQLDAVLGYPVFKALGVVTFAGDEFLAGDTAASKEPGLPMYMRGLTPVVECEVEGQPLLFTLDTGASSSDLSVRYYERFRAEAGSWKTQNVESAGAGGSIHQDVHIQPRVLMKIGATSVTLQDVSIMSTRMNAAIDLLFGNLGQDVLDSVTSLTLNFTTMTFTPGSSRQKKPL